MRKQKENAVVALNVPANEVNEVLAIANVAEIVENPKEAVVKAPSLTESEKTAIKAQKSALILSGCEIPPSFTPNLLKEGFTLFASTKEGKIFKKIGICGIDKLSVKEDATAQYFFYKNSLSDATLIEIFGSTEKIPALQKFSTGKSSFNTFIRCEASFLPALVAASIATPFALALVSEAEKAEAKAEAKAAEKNAKIESVTEEVKETV